MYACWSKPRKHRCPLLTPSTGCAAALERLCAALGEHAAAAAAGLPGLVAAAALALHAAAADLGLLRTGFCAADAGAARTLRVLRALHGALGAAARGAEHGALRGAVGIQMGLLLGEAGELAEARAAARSAVAALAAARVEAAAARRGGAGEAALWSSACRVQADARAEAVMSGGWRCGAACLLPTGSIVCVAAAGLTQTPPRAPLPPAPGLGAAEQELACLHADALALHFRLELEDGRRDASARASARRAGLLAASARRDAQAAVFGARTAAQRRGDDARAEAAGRALPNTTTRERELLEACGGNPYERALLLAQMAALQPDAARQATVLGVRGGVAAAALHAGWGSSGTGGTNDPAATPHQNLTPQEAAASLEAAQAAEAALLLPAPQSPVAGGSGDGSFAPPRAPRLLQRGPDFLELTHGALTGRGLKAPAAFAVFCKPTGAGVGLSINRTAMEHPGAGQETGGCTRRD
jgi:hypothetical protein